MKSGLLISLCLVFLCSCQELPIEEYAVIPQPAEIEEPARCRLSFGAGE